MLIRDGLQREQEIKLEDALTEYKGCEVVAAIEQSTVRMLNKNGQAVYYECDSKANETTNNNWASERVFYFIRALEINVQSIYPINYGMHCIACLAFF